MGDKTCERSDRITHEGYSYAFSDKRSDGTLLFKCQNEQCSNSIIVKKERTETGSKYKLLSKTAEHLSSKCKNYKSPRKPKVDNLNASIYEDCGEKDNTTDNHVKPKNFSLGPVEQDLFNEIKTEINSLCITSIDKQKSFMEKITNIFKSLSLKHEMIETLNNDKEYLLEKISDTKVIEKNFNSRMKEYENRIETLVESASENENAAYEKIKKLKEKIILLEKENEISKEKLNKVSQDYENLKKSKEQVMDNKVLDKSNLDNLDDSNTILSQLCRDMNDIKSKKPVQIQNNQKQKADNSQNQKTTLQHPKAPTPSTSHVKINAKTSQNTKLYNNKKEDKKHIFIIGDEHVQDLAFKSESFIPPENHTFSTYHIPGKNFNFIVNALQPEKLKSASTIFLIAGLHDVLNTPFKNIEVSLWKLRKKCHDKKLVIVSVPPRYDSEYGYKQVVSFNKKLKQSIQSIQGMSYLESHAFIQTKHMARDMTHLNKTGKFTLTIRISRHVKYPNWQEEKQVTFESRQGTHQTAKSMQGNSYQVRQTPHLTHNRTYHTQSHVYKPSTKPAYQPSHLRYIAPTLPLPTQYTKKQSQPVIQNPARNQLPPFHTRSQQFNQKQRDTPHLPPTYSDILRNKRVNNSYSSTNQSYYMTNSYRVFDTNAQNFRVILTTLV